MSDYGLSVQQLDVINALSRGASMSDAADEAGIHRNTIAVWRRNSLPFQHALADAQYDRALLFRERAEAAADLAFATIHEILADPSTPPSVRLKAALAIIQLATTPPPPKQQIELVLPGPSEMHNSAQSTPSAPAAPPARTVNNLHNSAQSTPTPAAQFLHNSAQQPLQTSVIKGQPL